MPDRSDEFSADGRGDAVSSPAADGTHRSRVDVLAFFGFRALRAAFRSHDVTVTRVRLWSKQCMHLVPHINWYLVPTGRTCLTFKQK